MGLGGPGVESPATPIGGVQSPFPTDSSQGVPAVRRWGGGIKRGDGEKGLHTGRREVGAPSQGLAEGAKGWFQGTTTHLGMSLSQAGLVI